jgi:ParB/RepB/Spo0J family partition protein
VSTAANGLPRPVENLVRLVLWRRVRPMPDQPREYFDQDALRELADSIAAVGQIVPAQVHPLVGDRHHDYELIDGQRRWHAVQMAGKDCLKVEVLDEPDPERRYAISVAANFSRQGHHPMEVARALGRMQKTMTADMIATVIGMSTHYVYQYLSLLKLHPDVQDAMHPTVPKENRIPVAAGAKLATLPHPAQRVALAKIQASRLSPLRATIETLATLPKELRPKSRSTKPSNLYVLQVKRLDRFISDFSQSEPANFAEVIRKRPAADVLAVRSRLNRLAALCKERADLLT